MINNSILKKMNNPGRNFQILAISNRHLCNQPFEDQIKRGLPPRGLDFLKNVCDAVTIPVYGIGGIKFDPQQWNSLKKQGAFGGCIMSGMMQL